MGKYKGDPTTGWSKAATDPPAPLAQDVSSPRIKVSKHIKVNVVKRFDVTEFDVLP